MMLKRIVLSAIVFGCQSGAAAVPIQFNAPKSYLAGKYPQSPVVADFNGDKLLDLAVANEGANTVSILLNNGRGGFLPQATYTVGSGPYTIALGDFNADGHPDLAVTNLFTGDVFGVVG